MSIASGQESRCAGAENGKDVHFPSIDWFERLALVQADNEETFRDFGPIDCTMVAKIDDQLFEIAFAGFGVTSIRRLTSLAEAAPSHFVVEGPLTVWREMLENIRAKGAPDLQHTLNYLTFPDVPMRVTGPDQLEIDAFYRYNESLQRFFNGAAKVPTTFR